MAVMPDSMADTGSSRIDGVSGQGDTLNYDAPQYASHCGAMPYARTHSQWETFFGGVADQIAALLRTRRALDAGWAHGVLEHIARAQGECRTIREGRGPLLDSDPYDNANLSRSDHTHRLPRAARRTAPWRLAATEQAAP
jgi:hypothetical protein